MMNIKVIFPDKNEQTFSAGVTVGEAIGGWQKDAIDFYRRR